MHSKGNNKNKIRDYGIKQVKMKRKQFKKTKHSLLNKYTNKEDKNNKVDHYISKPHTEVEIGIREPMIIINVFVPDLAGK